LTSCAKAETVTNPTANANPNTTLTDFLIIRLLFLGIPRENNCPAMRKPLISYFALALRLKFSSYSLPKGRNWPLHLITWRRSRFSASCLLGSTSSPP
jgi:hypothetical protein